MKIDRLIGIITVLLQKDKTTAPELAERFEVSRRTINRDIEDISKAGIPLITTQGYGGGIAIADGYKIDKALFTADEWQAVFTALQGIDSVSKTSYLTRLLEKLSTRDTRMTVDDTMTIDLASHYQGSLTPKLDALKAAIRGQHTVRFNYYYEKGERQRTIEPYRLVFQWASWYIYGYCLDRQAFRLFKLNRLWDLEIATDQFACRDIDENDLRLNWEGPSASYRLKALFEPSETYRLIDEYGMNCWTETDGKLCFEWTFSSYSYMREWIFSFGERVTVLEPPELQADRERAAKKILRLS